MGDGRKKRKKEKKSLLLLILSFLSANPFMLP